jgi:hypothetical protein
MATQRAQGSIQYEYLWWSEIMRAWDVQLTCIWHDTWKTAWELHLVFSDDDTLYNVEKLIGILDAAKTDYARFLRHGCPPTKKYKVVSINGGKPEVVAKVTYGTYETEKEATDACNLLATSHAETRRIDALHDLHEYGKRRLEMLTPAIVKDKEAIKSDVKELDKLHESVMGLTKQQVEQLPPSQRMQVQAIRQIAAEAEKKVAEALKH